MDLEDLFCSFIFLPVHPNFYLSIFVFTRRNDGVDGSLNKAKLTFTFSHLGKVYNNKTYEMWQSWLSTVIHTMRSTQCYNVAWQIQYSYVYKYTLTSHVVVITSVRLSSICRVQSYCWLTNFFKNICLPVSSRICSYRCNYMQKKQQIIVD